MQGGGYRFEPGTLHCDPDRRTAADHPRPFGVSGVPEVAGVPDVSGVSEVGGAASASESSSEENLRNGTARSRLEIVRRRAARWASICSRLVVIEPSV